MMQLSSRLRTLSLALACTALLAACGGGGSDPSDPVDPPVPPPPPPPPVQTLAGKHTGSWTGCVPDAGGAESSQLHAVIMGEASPATAGFHYRVDVFANRDCSGDYTGRYQELGFASFLGESKEVDGLAAEKVEVSISNTYASGTLASAPWQMPGSGVYKRLFALVDDGTLAIADLTGDVDANGFAERLIAPSLARVPEPTPVPSMAFGDRYAGTWSLCVLGGPEPSGSTLLRYTLTRTSATTLDMAYHEFQFDNEDCAGTGTLSYALGSETRIVAMGQSMVSGIQSDRYLVHVPDSGGPGLTYLGVAAIDGNDSLLLNFGFPGDIGDGFPEFLPSVGFARN